MKQFYSSALLFLFFCVAGYAQTYNMSNAATVNTCSGTFYDSGGESGSYNNNESFIRTFCSDLPGSQISLTFTSFTSEQCCDHLYIYDGPNTTGNLLVQAEGVNPAIIIGQVITSSTDGCLTIKWTSDGSVTNPGWVALISCTFPCQPFNITIDNPSTPFYNGDTIRICQNTPLTLNVTGSYPTSGTNYAQSDATTSFHWEFGDGSLPLTGTGITLATHTWPVGAYNVIVRGTDQNFCTNSNFACILILVSAEPNFQNSYIYPDTICLGSSVLMEAGMFSENTWTHIVDTMVAGLTYLPDGQGHPIETTITNSHFLPDQTISSITDVASVCLNIEHSYIGDLTIWLICPSGQYLNILTYPNGYGSTYFGQPIDIDSNTAPGVGATYCWTPTATVPLPVMGGTTAPAGNYATTGSFTDLLGCVLNGNWTIHVEDNIGSDNGYIFWWSLNFNSDIVPPQFSYTNTYNPADFYWTSGSSGGIVSQSNGSGTAIPTSLGNQIYNLHVVDNFGCDYDTSFIVAVNPNTGPCCSMPYPNAGIDDDVCGMSYLLHAENHLQNTGVWTLASGNPGNASFSNPSAYNSNVSVTAYGVYTFIWTETYNSEQSCVFSDIVQITFTPQTNAEFDFTPISCFGISSNINFTGSAPSGSTYSWNFDGAIINSGIDFGPYNVAWYTPGTHTIQLTVSKNNCTSSVSHSIYVPAPLSYTVSQVNNKCHGECAGMAIINVSGGTPPYTYLNAENSPVLTNLCSGYLGLKAIDANGCFIFTGVTITEPESLAVEYTVSHPLCYGTATGNIIPQVTGGSMPYSFAWSDGSLSSSLNSITAGSYSLTVRDTNNCFLYDTIIINEPSEIILTTNKADAHCSAGDGYATVAITGGIAPYFILWNDVLQQTNDTALNLTAGAYQVQITDNNQCVKTAIVAINNIDGPSLVLSATPVTTCYGDSTGSADVIVSGGVQPYQLLWSNGSTNETITGLPAGMHSVVVTDYAGCIGTGTVLVLQPDELQPLYDITDNLCFGGNNGSIAFSASGGTAPYSLQFSGFSFMLPYTYSNLNADIYTFLLLDANNCSKSISITVNEPDIVYHTANSMHVSCNGGSDGAILLSTAGGTYPYSYIWSTSDTTSSISNLHAGIFTLTFTDAHACSDVTSFSIAEPPAIIINDSVMNASGASMNDGAIYITVSGGTAPYHFLWSNNQASEDLINVLPGNYTVTVVDNQGCFATNTVFVDFVNQTKTIESLMDLRIFPNPTTGEIYVHCELASLLEIFDIYGRNLLKISDSAAENKIDIAHFSQGTYFIRVINKKHNKVLKIIKQ